MTDPTDHWMVSRSDAQLVARFAVAREARDQEELARVWRVLVVRIQSRIRFFAKTFAPGGDPRNRLPAAELEDAISRAAYRFAFKLPGTFRGVSMGELVNATKQLTSFACLDVFDELVKREGRTVSVDEPARDGGAGGRHDADVAATLRAELERREEAAGAAARVDAAFARLGNANYREVLELDLLGVPDEEIAARLGITLDNVYARRSRGLKALRGLIDADA